MPDEIIERLEREHLYLAPIKKRAVAALIDELLLSFILMFVLWDTLSQAQTLEEMIMFTNAFVLEFMAIKIIYQALFTWQYGATIGKIMMKIRIIELSTLGTPSLAVAFNRAIFRIISEMIFYLGYLWGMLDPLRQTWHDKTARTVVIDA